MRRLIAALFLAGAADVAVSACDAEARTQWNFIVRLDGERIGTHRFVVEKRGDGTETVQSDAHFVLRFLGWTAYRYEHHSRETWSGGCLAALDARTDDDGRVTQVRAIRADGGLAIDAIDAKGRHARTETLPGCAMSFAYWNTALRSQQQLLDPGTGRIVDVRITPLEPLRIDTDHGAANARGWRIAGPPNAIDIRWAGDEWVGLDTVVGHGRHLTYRLK
ncbi:MAG TPA: DUF6134 family protein [Ramlibacter sp.]